MIDGRDFPDGLAACDPENIKFVTSPIHPTNSIFHTQSADHTENMIPKMHETHFTRQTGNSETGDLGFDPDMASQGYTTVYPTMPALPETERARLFTRVAMSDLEVRKRREIEHIRTEEEEKRAKKRADVASVRELKRTKVDVGVQGEIIISLELFSGDQRASASFYVGHGLARYTSPDRDGEVLALPVVFRDGELRTVYLDLLNMNEKNLNRTFDRMGIRFGYSSAKEAEIRALFFNAVIQRAPSIELPPQHGFWRHNGEWDYAMPEDLTAREVWNHV